MTQTPVNTPTLCEPGPPLQAPSIPHLAVASEQDFLGSIKPEPIAQLIRKSLKRALDIFVGNVGIDTSRLWEVNEPREKRIRLKLLDDYNIRSSDEEPKGALDSDHATHQKLLALEGKSVVKDLQSTTGVLPAQPHLPPSGLLAGPRAPAPVSALVPTKKSSGSSDVLQHLVFRRPLRIPKATQHHKWELMKVISGHQGWVRALSVDPSNEWFVSGGNDRLIKIWDLATGQLKLSLTGHINTIRALEVSHRHPYLFSCGEDQMVKCWDLEYNKVIRHYHGHLSGVYSMALHPSLDILSTGGRDAVVRVWDMRTKVAVHVLSGHTGTVMSLASQKPEPQIISGSLDKMIRCWDLVAGRSAVVLTHHKKAIRALALHPREYTFCSGAADHLKVWKCPMGQFERNLEPVGTIINSIGIRDEPSTGSGIVVGGSDQGHLHFWDWGSGQKFQTIETIPQPGSLSGEKAIYALKFDMSETRLLTAECDKTIKIWRETATGSSTAAAH